jgi:cytochrome c-type biogenesis protein CcsB
VPVDAHLAHISDALFARAVLCYAVAMLAFAAEFTFGRRAAVRNDEPTAARWTGRAAVALTVLGWGLHIGSVTTRGLAAHRVPWGNMYEFSSMVTLVAVTVFLALLLRRPVRFLGAFVLAPVVVYLMLAGTVLYTPDGPLQPVLNSYWIKIHVVGAIVASGAFMVSAVLTVLYLVKDRFERKAAAVSVGPGTATSLELRPAAVGLRGRAQAMATGVARWLPGSERLDRLAYRVITFAFPVWTFAIMAGAIWAKYAWSRYWGWDPKETWSFITWVVYAAYLHARATAGWRGRRAAVLSLVGFSALMVDYYLVNTVITGLHSYAGVG